MPSGKNPVTVVLPGPGKLPAGTVTASALLFPPGGGSSAGLSAHITDPVDAHMASAIGVNPLNPAGLPILTTAGGTVDGESVLDFIDAAKDLFPIRPDQIGNEAAGIPNSGLPEWYDLNEVGVGTGLAVTGGFTRGAGVGYTHFLVPSTVVTSVINGMVYPADRGILAVYYSTTGDYTTGTLMGALWLGSSAVPAGVPPPSPIFSEALRPGQQGDWTASYVGLDTISLSSRVAYLKDYSAYAVPWAAFEANFPRYQVGYYNYPITTISPGDAGSWLVVHWKESYATTLASIQPGMLATELTTVNCYSAVTPDLDTLPARNTNRRNVFVDGGGPSPAGASFTTGINPGPPFQPTVFLSGVVYYTGSNMRWDINVQADNLFDNCYYTGTTNDPNGPPGGFESTKDPLSFDFSDFGWGSVSYRFSELRKFGTFVNYSTANPPATSDTAELDLTALSMVGVPAETTPSAGYAVIRAILRRPFQTEIVYDDASVRYLFNSYVQTGASTSSTDTFEPFNDEKYRYLTTYSPSSPAVGIEPAGADHRNPSTIITDSGTGNQDAQVNGSKLLYPFENYGVGYMPVSVDYAAVFAADAANWIRRYQRAFDTGAARNTGRLRIRVTGAGGFAQFQSNGPWTGDEVTDHSGGMIIQIKVPGATGWLDLGRLRGDPSLGIENSKGCITSVSVSGSDVIVSYNTTEYTVDNGSGKYPLFVLVSYIKGVGGGEPIEEIEWLAP